MATLTPPSSRLSRFSRLPSFVWIILFVLGIAALIGGIILLFYALTNIEGFASVLMIVIAWLVIRVGTGNSVPTESSSSQRLIVAAAITFFALMGMAIDQPGNYVYNRPLQWFFCPSGTELHRGVDVTHPLPGRTDVTQDFTCVDPRENAVIDNPSMGGVIITRFVEYVLVAYGLIALNRLYLRVRRPGRDRSAPAG
jgi:hypothetical protein